MAQDAERPDVAESTKSLPFIVFVVSIGVVLCVLPTWLILRLFTHKISFIALVSLFLLQLVGVLLLNFARHNEGWQRTVFMWSSVLMGAGFLGGCIYLIALLAEA